MQNIFISIGFIALIYVALELEIIVVGLALLALLAAQVEQIVEQ
jgi:hypothetical protein